MPDWFAMAVGVAGIASTAIAVVAWVRPRPKTVQLRNAVRGDVEVVTVNTFPVFQRLDGTSDLGNHQIAVTVRNLGELSILVKSWGIDVGDGGNLVDLRGLHSNPTLPQWVASGADLSFYMPAADVRKVAAERQMPFEKMHGWVSLADGRQVFSRKPVPLA